MAETPIITVIIPTFNNRVLIELCLRSMRSCTRQPFRVIVRDNGSTDGTIEYLENCGLVDLIIRSSVNDIDNAEYLAYDDAIRHHVETPYFLVCHSDIVFVLPDWIAEIRRHGEQDEIHVAGGQVFPSSYSGKWIFGRWLSPWYAWGRTEAFRRLDLTWRRRFPDWCAQRAIEFQEYFDRDLLRVHPSAPLFWEHGGHLVAQIERSGGRVFDRSPTGIFHIGDMTGSTVKAAHFPEAADVGPRIGRATAIARFIAETLARTYADEGDFRIACRSVVAFARRNDREILKAFRD